MTTTINGNGTNPQATEGYVQRAIASSTNTSPIEVTTSVNHGYNDGDTVEIEAHQTNTAANGLWAIQKTAANKFKLIGSTGNGVGGATGYAVDYSVNPLLTVPEDLVDDVDASTVNPAFEGLFDLAPWMYQRVGQYRVLESKYTYLGSYFGTTTGNANLDTTFRDTGLGPLVSDWALKSSDIIVAKLVGAVFCTGTVETVLGIAFDWGAGATLITGGSIDLTPSNSNTAPSPVSIQAILSGQSGNSVSISIQSRAAAGGPFGLQWRGEAMLSLLHLRRNQ